MRVGVIIAPPRVRRPLTRPHPGTSETNTRVRLTMSLIGDGLIRRRIRFRTKFVSFPDKKLMFIVSGQSFLCFPSGSDEERPSRRPQTGSGARAAADRREPGS